MRLTRRYTDVLPDNVDHTIEIVARWLIQPERTRSGLPKLIRFLGELPSRKRVSR
jgi:hypothetical protein